MFEFIGMAVVAISLLVGVTFITATISTKFWKKVVQIQMKRIITIEEEEDNE